MGSVNNKCGVIDIDMKSSQDFEHYSVHQLRTLVGDLVDRLEKLERDATFQRGTPAGIREAYSMTKRMQSDWEQIDRMELTIKEQSDYIQSLEDHIKELSLILEHHIHLFESEDFSSVFVALIINSSTILSDELEHIIAKSFDGNNFSFLASLCQSILVFSETLNRPLIE